MNKNIFSILKEGFVDLFTRPPVPTGSPHTAKFGHPSAVLKSQHTGFCLTGNKRISREMSHQHSIIYGASGTGKSSVVLIPSLLTINASLVVFDPGEHLYNATAAALAVKKGYRIKRLNFGNPAVSNGFNPLTYFSSESEINQLAELVVSIALGNDPKTTYWNELTITLLRYLIQIAKTRDKTAHTFAYIYRLLSWIEATPEKFLRLVEETHQPKLITAIRGFLARDSKLKSYVITNSQAALQRYSDPGVALVSSFDSLDLGRLRETPTVIYVQVEPSQHQYFTTPISLFWEVLFKELMKAVPTDHNVPVYCLIDEAGWLRLPNLSTIIAVARKHFGILLAVQNSSQLEAVHGVTGKATIEANAFSKLFSHSQTPQLARDLSRMLGMSEIDDTVRPLMTDLEIRMMNQRRGLLICGNLPPMLPRLHPYYLQPHLHKWVKYSQKHASTLTRILSRQS